MSQQIRRVLATVGVTAALLLAVPAPSRAAGFREPARAADLIVMRFWSWMDRLMPAFGPTFGMTAKTATVPTHPSSPAPIAPTQPPPPSGTGSPGDQGSMIDPEGVK